MKKLLPVFISLIIVISVPVSCFAYPGDIPESELIDWGVIPFNDVPFIFVPYSSYNYDQYIIYFPSDKLDFIHYDPNVDQIINTSSSTITTVGYDSSGDAHTFRMTSFGSLEIREFYGVNLQQTRYVPFMLNGSSIDIYCSNFMDEDFNIFWFSFSSYQIFIICILICLLVFTLLNWWLLHKVR